MHDRKLNNINYYLIAFGISFSSIFITYPVSISITDIIILLILSYAIFSHQRLAINYFVFWFLLFILEILIVNLINYSYISDFSLSGFLINYLRLIAAFLVILFIPSLTKSFDLVAFNKALLFVIKFHCLITFFDTFVTYPWLFDENGFGLNTRFEDLKRAQGLFGEPSFFAAYVALMTSLVIQFQANSRIEIIKPVDFGIILIGMVASSSLTGIILSVVLIIQICFVERDQLFKFTSFLRTLLFTAISTLIAVIFLSFSVAYLSSRLTNIEDGSTLQRMVGSTVLSSQILDDHLMTGVGLGGHNFRLFLEKSDTSILFDAIETDSEGGVDLQTASSTYWSALIAGGGLPLLILFYGPIMGYLIFNKKTVHVGIMIFLLGIAKSGVFEISLWWTIATVLGFRYAQEIKEEQYLNTHINDYKS